MMEVVNLQLYLKVFLALIGGLVTISKLRVSFASHRWVFKPAATYNTKYS